MQAARKGNCIDTSKALRCFESLLWHAESSDIVRPCGGSVCNMDTVDGLYQPGGRRSNTQQAQPHYYSGQQDGPLWKGWPGDLDRQLAPVPNMGMNTRQAL